MQRKNYKMMKAQTQVFQSKFGFHPCTRETDKKLRFLNGIYQKALSMSAAWERWDRKAPHNRVLRRRLRDEQGRVIGRETVLDDQAQPIPMPEPEICPIFSDKMLRKTNWSRDGKYHRTPIEITVVETDGPYILAAARQARKPQPTAEDVRPLPLSEEEEIDALYQRAKEWLER